MKRGTISNLLGKDGILEFLFFSPLVLWILPGWPTMKSEGHLLGVRILVGFNYNLLSGTELDCVDPDQQHWMAPVPVEGIL